MRILHIGQASGNSNNGVHRSISTLAGLASANGHEALAVRFSRSVAVPECSTSDGVEQHSLPVVGPPGPAGSFLQLLTSDGRKALKDLLVDVDLLHLHSVFQIDHTFVTDSGVPYVVTPHGGYHPRVLARTNPRRKRVWGALFDKRILARASAVHVLTDNEARHVTQLQPRARTHVLPIPLDGLPVVLPRAAPDGPVVFMGRLDVDHKGLDLLLDAWARTRNDWATEKELVIAGPGDVSTAREIAQLIARLGLQGGVRVIGPVSGHDKTQLLTSASWFVHTSRREGLPLAMVEAAAYGAPLLATRETNMKGLIDLHGAGLSSGEDVQGIADMFTVAASMSTQDYRVRSQGAIQLAHEFRPEALWPAYDRLYRDVSRGG